MNRRLLIGEDGWQNRDHQGRNAPYKRNITERRYIPPISSRRGVKKRLEPLFEKVLADEVAPSKAYDIARVTKRLEPLYESPLADKIAPPKADDIARVTKRLEPLFETPLADKIAPAIAELAHLQSAVPHEQSKMPPVNAEETALLGVVPLDNMVDIELKNIELRFPSVLRLSTNSACEEVRVQTDRGVLAVAVQGDRAKPAILTYHDLGLNHVFFQPFFNFVDMRALLENFCVYHVNAPGQEEGAPSFPDSYQYPTMDVLANQLNYVMGHFGFKSFVGFGVGVGANILARFALAHPQKVDALALIHCTSNQAGWLEWACQKINTHALRSRGMTEGVIDYLMWHHFGRLTGERNLDLAQTYRSYFMRNVNPTNLAMFIESYVRRSDLAIARDGDTLKVPVLNLTGALSPHVDDTVTFNGRLQPANSTWMKISDCALVQDEQPGTVSQAFRLFLQGEGYAAPLSPTKIVAFRRLSDAEARERERERARTERAARRCLGSAVIRITENPISDIVVC